MALNMIDSFEFGFKPDPGSLINHMPGRSWALRPKIESEYLLLLNKQERCHNRKPLIVGPLKSIDNFPMVKFGHICEYLNKFNGVYIIGNLKRLKITVNMGVSLRARRFSYGKGLVYIPFCDEIMMRHNWNSPLNLEFF